MNNSKKLVFKINPGNPIKNSEINIHISGDGKYDIDFQRIIKDSQSLIGIRLNHNDYEQLKNKLYSLAIYKGYFDAQFHNNQLIVVPSLYKCIWNINFYSGERYIFKDIKFQGSQIQNNYLKNICNIRIGEYYSAQDVLELNRRLSSTNWFQSIAISPNFVLYSQEKKLILNVLFTPNIKNDFEFGLGFANDIGFRSKIIWKKPCINSYGHSLENHFNLSFVEQCVNINYKIPLIRNPLTQYYLIQSSWFYENIYDLKSKIVTLNIARYWEYSNYWQQVVNLRWYIDHYIKNNESSKITTRLICPGFSINRVKKKGRTCPFWGNSHRYSINISTKYLGSDINFFILQSQNVYIQKVFEKNRFLIRNSISWIQTKNLSYVEPLFRLFLTKDRYIRGYTNTFSSLNSNYLKYTKLIISAFEYQYHLFSKCWGVVFLDIGEMINVMRWHNFQFGVGIGTGIRWHLPIGPLQLDLAIPLIDIIKLNYKLFQIYINLGSEL